MKTIEVALQEIKRIREEQDETSGGTNNTSHTKNITADDGKKCIFMISNEVPYVMAKAVEMFIRDITTRAWIHTESNRRKTIQKPDITHATSETETYDFLIDVIPRITTTTTTMEVNNTYTTTTNNENNNATASNAATATEHVTNTITATPAVLAGHPFTRNRMTQQQQPSATHVNPMPLSEPQPPIPPVVPPLALTEQHQQLHQGTNNNYPPSYSTIPQSDSIHDYSINKEDPLRSTPMTTGVIFSPLTADPPPSQPPPNQDDATATPHRDETSHPGQGDLHQEPQLTTNYYESTSSPQQQWNLE